LIVRFLRKAAGPLLLLLGLVFLVVRNGPHTPARASSVPALAGRVIDAQAQPVRRAKVALYLDEAEEPYIVGETQRDGLCWPKMHIRSRNVSDYLILW
jgi:hypothetical protein